MEEFVGTYKLISTKNFDEFLKALDVNLVTRKMANVAIPVQDIRVNGDVISIKTMTKFKTIEIKFKLGKEFDETTADGRKVKTIFTQEGNKLIQIQRGTKTISIVREFHQDSMTMVLTVDDIVCTRLYKKED